MLTKQVFFKDFRMFAHRLEEIIKQSTRECNSSKEIAQKSQNQSNKLVDNCD